ncbi:hypothetical protein [Novosphingobium sp. LASN5T]|uniref:hypothetical protein n=1 Tax=Novosphingobium sp. LASN5T TaxID=2491021 RepID=UPI000F5F024B|nr:hypothetical protein [Novosphingobium sp. LASN5T]RQW43198.1 hypothetical protein EH199_14090 [Novosphingobium sp. LASN5T]
MTIPQGKQAKRKQAASISAHRLFPVVMMVWFAALLGLTSFVVPPRMLASLVVASGLPKVLPAAAPPLGFTARVLVAFALAVVGGLIGLVIAARLRRGKAVKLDMPATPDRDEAMESGAPAVAVSQRAVKIRSRDAHPDAPPRRPLVLSEELATVPALEDPEPGGELEQPVIAEDWGAEVPVDGADLSRTALEAADPDETAGQDDVLADEVGAPARLAAPMIDDGPFAPPLLALPAALADEPSADADLDLAGLEAPPGEDDARLPLASDTQRPFVQPYPTLPAPGIFNDAAEARADAPAMDAAPLESLGLVQLIERLAMAIAVRRDELARHAEQDPRAEAEVDATPPPGTATHAADAAEQGVEDAEAGGEADASPFLAIVPGEAPLPEHRYPSLVDMPSPAPRRHDDAPVDPPFARPDTPLASRGRAMPSSVTEPAPPAFAPPAGAVPAFSDPEEADRALRAALATLQRMTAKG